MYLWNERSPSLAFYRPNQAMNTVYTGYPGLTGLGAPPVVPIAQMKAIRAIHGLGHWKNASQSHTGPGMGEDTTTTVDPKLLLTGVGLLAAGMFLLGGKHGPRLRKRKAARLRRRLASLEG